MTLGSAIFSTSSLHSTPLPMHRLELRTGLTHLAILAQGLRRAITTEFAVMLPFFAR